jgi:hypothetical protein
LRTGTRLGLVVAALIAAACPGALAHDGPPYAVLVDHPLGERRLEVWTDPDIGTGRYWIILTAASEGASLSPPDELQVCVAPRGVGQPESCATAQREPADGVRYYAEVPFPEGGWWTTRILIRDGERVQEAAVDVEATPPGVGLVGFAIYLFPFVGFGLIFLKLALMRRRLGADARTPAGSLTASARRGSR